VLLKPVTEPLEEHQAVGDKKENEEFKVKKRKTSIIYERDDTKGEKWGPTVAPDGMSWVKEGQGAVCYG
jgi:hypothetical protein